AAGHDGDPQAAVARNVGRPLHDHAGRLARRRQAPAAPAKQRHAVRPRRLDGGLRQAALPMVSVMRAVLIAAALATACPAAAAPMTVADLTWMEGLWVQAGERETVRETWLPAAGAQMVGVSQTDRPGARAFHEFM